MRDDASIYIEVPESWLDHPDDERVLGPFTEREVEYLGGTDGE